MKQIVLYAPNVHTGGGLVLLKDLIREWPAGLPICGYFDQRAFSDLELPESPLIKWVRPTLLSRFKAEVSLSKESVERGNIVMFNSLPPLFSCAQKVIVFMQNKILLEEKLSMKYSGRSYLRLLVERSWAHIFRSRVKLYIVQTSSMRRSLEKWHCYSPNIDKPVVRVFPFMRQIFLDGSTPSANVEEQYDFIYAADGQAHKNHSQLFMAWRELARDNLYPSLAITLDESEKWLLDEIDNLRRDGINVKNLGWLDREAIIAKYRTCKAIIFPSINESFGMPLLEASMLGMPILASELDYVYDVCIPAQTFNPSDPRSIARSVRRHIGADHALEIVRSPGDFVRYVSNFQKKI